MSPLARLLLALACAALLAPCAHASIASPCSWISLVDPNQEPIHIPATKSYVHYVTSPVNGKIIIPQKDEVGVRVVREDLWVCNRAGLVKPILSKIYIGKQIPPKIDLEHMKVLCMGDCSTLHVSLIRYTKPVVPDNKQ